MVPIKLDDEAFFFLFARREFPSVYDDDEPECETRLARGVGGVKLSFA